MRDMPPSGRRYRRPAVSCTFCRKRKVRCNREFPCSTCIRTGNESCIYERRFPPSPPSSQVHNRTNELRPAASRLEASSPESIDPNSSTSRSLVASSHAFTISAADRTSPASQFLVDEIHLMRRKVRELEETLSKLTKGSPPTVHSSGSHFQIATQDTAALPHMHQASTMEGNASIIRHFTYKTRRYGGSYWLNGTSPFKDNFIKIQPYLEQEMSTAPSELSQCKALAKFIKMKRSPPFPCSPVTDLPSKDVADKLISGYLRTIETVYRILHVPTFRREYGRIWNSTTKPDVAFMVKLKLVLAIGATVHDERFTLRASAIRWVCEAQTWLSEPTFKSRLSIEALQTMVLLLIARETASVGGELVWVSAGSLFRTAVFMGLHRDPAYLSITSHFDAEMRRRLWNTILEIVLQSSMDSGGPPLISLTDFDTAPPGNFDDNQLTPENALAKREDMFTETSLAICLRRAFSLRLSILKFLNDIDSSGSYDETLRLDKELRALHKTISESLRGYKMCSGQLVSAFGARMIDVVMCRYLSSLHIPVFDASFHKAAYAFSRKAVVDMAMRIWTSVNVPLWTVESPGHTTSHSPFKDDLLRLAVCNYGFFHTIALQSSYVVAAELRAQLCENANLESALLRPDLFSVIEDAKAFALRCIEAGETNIKNYLFINLCSAEINGIIRGVSNDESPQLLIDAAKDAVTRCLSIFELKAAQYREEDATDISQLGEMSYQISDDFIEDWDFMLSNPQYNFGFTELPL